MNTEWKILHTALYEHQCPSFEGFMLRELDTAEGFILHYEGTVQHLRTHIPKGKLNPQDQQHNTPTVWNTQYSREVLVCVFVCVL